MKEENIPGFTKEMLTGDAKKVADELQGDVASFFKGRGVKNASELDQAIRSGALVPSEITPVRQNIRVLQQIMRTGEVPKDYLERPGELEQQEQEAWFGVLGKNVEVKPLPSWVTPEVKRNLEDAGLALRYIPDLELDEEKLRQGTQANFVESLAQEYPTWRQYESLNDAEKSNPSISRNLEIKYWSWVREESVDFPTLPGQWVAVETSKKPGMNRRYERTGIGDKLGFGQGKRLGTSWDDITGTMESKKGEVLSDLGMTGHGDLRLLEAPEWNLLANREGWGKTITYEWTNTDNHSTFYEGKLAIGRFDGFSGGGASHVDSKKPSGNHSDTGWRAAIVLE